MDLIKEIKCQWRVLVVGDFIADHYRILCERKLSPEAPVVIFSQQRDEWRLGGAANVANNLMTMGADIHFASIVGEDWGDLRDRYSPTPFSCQMHICPGRKTVVKERLVTRRQQIARIDTQSQGAVPGLVAGEFGSKLFGLIPAYDIIVLSDYGHGVMTPSLTIPIIKHARRFKKKVVVDSKAMDSLHKYRRASIMLPNDSESRTMMRDFGSTLYVLASKMRSEMGMDAIGMTLGPEGILLVEKDNPPTVLPAHGHDEVVDITGAGDTVCAATALALASGASYREALEFANVAAGLVVSKMGVATVSFEEVADAWERRKA